MKNLLGLDLSLTSSGYAHNFKYGTITTKEKAAKRLYIISSEIINICIQNNIEAVIIEGYSFASRNSQAHSIGELGGCVRMRLWENKIPYIEVPPTVRAKFATGKGNASKNEVISSVSAMTGIIFQGSGADDMCDAWILYQIGLAHMGQSEYNWPKPNLEALNKIDWSSLKELYE